MTEDERAEIIAAAHAEAAAAPPLTPAQRDLLNNLADAAERAAR